MKSAGRRKGFDGGEIFLPSEMGESGWRVDGMRRIVFDWKENSILRGYGKCEVELTFG